MDELPSFSVNDSYPATNDAESLPGLPSLFSFPAAAPAISAPLAAVALQQLESHIPSPLPSLKRTSPEPVSTNAPPPPPGPRKRGRKSKQDLLNRVALTPEQKKANHMVAEQRRRALVRSSLHELSMLVGMKPPIEGDGSSVGSADGSSRVEILEGGKMFVEGLLRRNAALRELLLGQHLPTIHTTIDMQAALLLLATVLAPAMAAVIAAGSTGITFNGQDNGDGTTSLAIRVPATANAQWVGIGFSATGSAMSSDQLHIVWYSGSSFIVSDRTGSRDNGNLNQLSLVSGTIDGSGNWDVVFKRTSSRLPFGPGSEGDLFWAMATGVSLTATDPTTSLPFHNGGYGNLRGALIEPVPVQAAPPASAEAPVVAPASSLPPPAVPTDMPASSLIASSSASSSTDTFSTAAPVETPAESESDEAATQSDESAASLAAIPQFVGNPSPAPLYVGSALRRSFSVAVAVSVLALFV
ncbi:hypothetical protein HDU80_000626 [Chytriomyces hyalinus]|nr:hypothetical protein HDU80_000626 [Chytriomyces hyalinus]